MGHLAAKKQYLDLQKRLNKNSIGAPDTKAMYDVLKILFSDEEAAIAAQMPMAFTRPAAFAKVIGKTPDETEKLLDKMADKALIMDMKFGKRKYYMLAPTVIGIFEFSMMRMRTDLDQKKLAHKLHEVVSERAFLETADGIQSFPLRVVAHESSMPDDTYTEVLDYERATHVVENAGAWSIGICHCRHVAHHEGRDCQKIEMESCMTLGPAVEWATRHGLAKAVSKTRALEHLAKTQEVGLVNMADNVQRNPVYMCNCCGCCCEVLNSFRKFNELDPVFSSNFQATINESACNGCGKCAKACPVDMIKLVPSQRVVNGKKVKKLAVVNTDGCIGCGVCHAQCKFEALTMESREVRRITPESTFQRVLMAALETGKLHHLLIEENGGIGMKAANRLVGAILNLPPAKQYLVQDHVRSRFINYITNGAKKMGMKGTDL